MRRASAAVGVAALIAIACATASSFEVPPGPWIPDPSGRGIVDAAMAPCRGVHTLTAEIAVRGRVGGSKIRGRVIAGFEQGGSLRLEAPAPFGAPVFILAARRNRAVLWLPRDRRVLQDAPVEDVLDAITGIRQSTDDLLALVAGCLTSAAPASEAPRRNSKGWLLVPIDDGSTAYFRRAGQTWRLAGGHQGESPTRPAWTVAYTGAASSAFPALIRMWRQGGADGVSGAGASLSLEISQLETNTSIESRAFDLVVPPDAVPMSLAELRQSGPLAERPGAAGGDHP